MYFPPSRTKFLSDFLDLGKNTRENVIPISQREIFAEVMNHEWSNENQTLSFWREPNEECMHGFLNCFPKQQTGLHFLGWWKPMNHSPNHQELNNWIIIDIIEMWPASQNDLDYAGNQLTTSLFQMHANGNVGYCMVHASTEWVLAKGTLMLANENESESERECAVWLISTIFLLSDHH